MTTTVQSRSVSVEAHANACPWFPLLWVIFFLNQIRNMLYTQIYTFIFLYQYVKQNEKYTDVFFNFVYLNKLDLYIKRNDNLKNSQLHVGSGF